MYTKLSQEVNFTSQFLKFEDIFLCNQDLRIWVRKSLTSGHRYVNLAEGAMVKWQQILLCLEEKS